MTAALISDNIGAYPAVVGIEKEYEARVLSEDASQIIVPLDLPERRSTVVRP